MSNLEEGVTPTMSRHFNPNGSMTVEHEQMHRTPVSKPDLKSFLGDPTPLYVSVSGFPGTSHLINKLMVNSGIMGFILALTPFACELMEFRGTFGAGAATMFVA